MGSCFSMCMESRKSLLGGKERGEVTNEEKEERIKRRREGVGEATCAKRSRDQRLRRRVLQCS